MQDENVLLGWYRTHIGPPDEESTVYGGFALFFGGIGLALVGIALFLWSATYPNDSMFMYTLREIAGVAGAVGLPALLVGVTVLLPVDRRAMYAAVVGSVVCLAGVALFTTAYPYAWNVPGTDRSGQVVAVYAVGLVGVIAATGAALVGHRVEQASKTELRTVVAEGEADGEDPSEEPAVTEEQVRRDIDEAMANTELSWGGVERKTNSKRLELNTDEIDDVDSTNVADVEATTTRSSGQNVDDAVSGLAAMRGGTTKEARSTSTTDDQTAALQELRQKQEAEELATAEEAGVVDRVKNLFSS